MTSILAIAGLVLIAALMAFARRAPDSTIENPCRECGAEVLWPDVGVCYRCIEHRGPDE